METRTAAFEAIVSFINDLWSQFGNPKVTSGLALYHRLIQHMKPESEKAVTKCVDGFLEFFRSNGNFVTKNDLKSIPRGTKINYGDGSTVFLEIQKYIYQSQNNPEVLEIIRNHLLHIFAILDPSEEKVEALEISKPKAESSPEGIFNIESSTPEGAFVNGVLNKVRSSVEGIQDTSNPMEAMMGIFSSGVFQDLVSGFQNGATNGQLNMNKLLTTMHAAIGSLIPPEEPKKSSENVEYTNKSVNTEPEKVIEEVEIPKIEDSE